MIPQQTSRTDARTWLVVGLAGAALLCPGLAEPAQNANAIVVENLRPGTTAWQITGRRPNDAIGEIQGFASATSVNKGESLHLFVTVNPAQPFSVQIFRMGWYGGAGGRLAQTIGPLNGSPQPPCPVDGTTGLIHCPWASSHRLDVPAAWVTGIYVALLTNASTFQSYIVFAVRDDDSRSALLYQQSVTTYQAYNNYPDDGKTGKSLYDFNSYGSPTLTGDRRAVKVSFDRPYAEVFDSHGAGQFFAWEYSFVRWLERRGYDVSYSTDLDTHQAGRRLLDHKAFLVVGHDEYWTAQMFDAVEAARDAGVNLGFFGANSAYWQVRLEPSRLGPDRVLVCYKDEGGALDPVAGAGSTRLWRSLGRPEQQLIGVQYSAWFDTKVHYAFVPASRTHWVFAGTGFERTGTAPGIVGYETDRLAIAYPLPKAADGTYRTLSVSPVTGFNGEPDVSESSIYRAPSGARVFAAGTIGWSRGLDDRIAANPGIEKMTDNVLQAFVTGIPPIPPPSAARVNATETGITLDWPGSLLDEGGFLIERASALGFVDPVRVRLPAGVTTYTDTAVNRLSTVYYRIAMFNGGEMSAFGPVVFPDADADGLPDAWEGQFGLGPASALGPDGAGGDPDGDGVTNLEEFRAGTHPRGFFTRYFAEGGTSSFFDTEFALANPTTTTAATLLRFQKDDGTSTSELVTVGALSRKTVWAKHVPGLSNTAFGTVVESDVLVVADRTMSWDENGYGNHAETGLPSPAPKWYLAEGATHSGFNLFYLLQNPSQTTDARVEVSYLLPPPLPPVAKTYVVPKGGRLRIWVNNEAKALPALAATDISAVLESTNGVPIVVERAMYLDRPGEPFAAGHASAAVPAPAIHWLLPEGATGPFFDLFVLIANPNAEPAELTAHFTLLDGTVVTRAYTVPGRSRVNIPVDQVDPRLADAAMSTTVAVTNGVPVVVERAMWWPGPTVATWSEAHDSVGATTTGTRWGLAAGEVGGPRHTVTYLLLANTSPFVGAAKVTLLFEDGTTASKTVTLPKSIRTNVDVGFEFPEAAGRRFGVVVESAGTPAAQIVVERVMYSDATGGVWAAGTSSLAVKLPN